MTNGRCVIDRNDNENEDKDDEYENEARELRVK